jgi:LAO/AO transport system kinase
MNEKQLNEWLKKRRSHKTSLNHTALLEGIKNGSISSLSSAITLLESSRSEDRSVAKELIKSCLPIAGNSIRLGITGVPGVGKSTFIESFGLLAVAKGYKVAVLAIDPSSEKSGGSILGDKTRMNELSQHPNVFIRPSAAGDSLGGVARKTRESIILCEAAGFDFILIETVGVGQSETAVHSMVDFFLLLMLAGAGDELQGIKRGIMEMADALVITKADGDNLTKAKMARREYQNAMHLFPPNENEWIPQALISSALEKFNLDKVLETIDSYVNQTKINGHFSLKRKSQDKYWLHETIREQLIADFYRAPQIREELKQVEMNVVEGRSSSFDAAEYLLSRYQKK